MKIKVNNNKEITEPLKKEMVWRAVGNVQDTIEYLYKKRGQCGFTNSQMEEIFYKLNDICMELSNDEDMEWQLEESNEN